MFTVLKRSVAILITVFMLCCMITVKAESNNPYSFYDYIVDNYDGSLLKATIYNTGSALITTRSTITVYCDPSPTSECVLCTLPDPGAVLLGTEYAEVWNTIYVGVWVLSPGTDVIWGYVKYHELFHE